MTDLKLPKRQPSRRQRKTTNKADKARPAARSAPSFKGTDDSKIISSSNTNSGYSAEPRLTVRPKKKRKRKGGWLRRFLFRFVVIVCLLSALPMVALRYIDPPTSAFIELNKSNNNTNIQHTWVEF